MRLILFVMILALGWSCKIRKRPQIDVGKTQYDCSQSILCKKIKKPQHCMEAGGKWNQDKLVCQTPQEYAEYKCSLKSHTWDKSLATCDDPDRPQPPVKGGGDPLPKDGDASVTVETEVVK